MQSNGKKWVLYGGAYALWGGREVYIPPGKYGVFFEEDTEFSWKDWVLADNELYDSIEEARDHAES